MSDLIETLRLACDDPMWADHVEMPKKLLRHSVDYLSALKKQVEELTAERDAIYRAAMDIFDETSMFLITEAQAKRSVAAAMNRARAALASTRETSDA